MGLLAFTSGGGLAMATLGSRAANRDVQIGTVLAFMLGLGVLFVGIPATPRRPTRSCSGKSWASAASTCWSPGCGGRPARRGGCHLPPAAVQLAGSGRRRSQGPAGLLAGVVFLLLVAIATSIAVQVVGVLLIFALMVTPPPSPTASPAARRKAFGFVLIALLATWSRVIRLILFALPRQPSHNHRHLCLDAGAGSGSVSMRPTGSAICDDENTCSVGG